MKRLPNTLLELKELVLQLMQENQSLREENKTIREKIDTLELKLKQRHIDPPPSIKPSIKKKKVDKSRKKRDSVYVRKKSTTPDQVVHHAQETCPDCQVSISGNSLAYEREVIDIPKIKAITTKHFIYKRRCWQCNKWWQPEIDWSEHVIGQSRFGVRLASLVATMTEHLRQPIGLVQSHLAWVYGLHLSQGSIVELRHKIAHLGANQHTRLKHIIRGSPVVNADETSHREDGVNSYTWGYSTKTERFFLYGRGRDANQVKEVLGDEFVGVLVTDYYAGYNCHDGAHQRCWAHLLRDVEKMVKVHDDTKGLTEIQNQIKDLFEEGKLIQISQLETKKKQECRRGLENRLLRIVEPHLDKTQKQHPFHTLAKRIDKYLDEHFTFVLDPNIPATNNAAERAVRHGVIARKISGGTRSKAGTRTKEILASLFGTWHVRGLNPLEECHKLLTDPNYSIAST